MDMHRSFPLGLQDGPPRGVSPAKRYGWLALCLAVALAVALGSGTRASAEQATAREQALGKEVQALRKEVQSLKQQVEGLRRQVDAQAQEALRLRQRAEADYQKAREALDRLLSQVAEVPPAKEADRDAVRRRLLQEALALFQKQLKEKGDDPPLRQKAGRAHHRLAALSAKYGQMAEAEQAYRQAQQLHEKLVAEFPEDRAYRQDLATTLNSLGQLYQHLGRLAEAVRS
jgi:tetratricopeptide (TPR) repeat protein